MRRRLHQRTGSLLALFAMLLITFAPTVSQLLAAQQHAGDLAADMCSAHASLADASEDHHSHGSLDHVDGQACGYCHFFAHAPVLPSASASSALVVYVQRAAVIAAAPSAHVNAPFSNAQPRAPPVLA
jgi:hypothetical protein